MFTHRSPAVVALAASLSLLTFTPALAQWPKGYSLEIGSDVTPRGAAAGFFYPGETSDDFYVALAAWMGAGGTDYQVAHVGTDAQLRWTATNVHLLGDPPLSLHFDPGFAPTGLGGFVDAFPSGSLRGAVADVHGVTSTLFKIGNSATSSSSHPSFCRADGGGVYVAWMGSLLNVSVGLRIQRLDASGAIAPGWPDTGWKARPSISANYPLQTAPDGSGGLLVAGTLSSGLSPFVQRIRGDTTVAAGWPATGLRLSSLTGSPFAPIRLARSDADHFIAEWVSFEYIGCCTSVEVVRCQRFSLSGSLDPAWPSDGVVVETVGTNDVNNLTCVEDGAGGIIAGWDETAHYRVRHIRADGTAPGRYASGSLVIFSGESPIGFAQGALARGQGEGSCVFWQDRATGIRGRWLDGDGNALGCGAPDDTCSALILADTGARVAGAMADGSGGAYILYGEYVASLDEVHYVTHTNDLATTSVPPAGRTSGLWLAVSPNPARALTATFVLPDARPARVEVLDLAGRRLLARDVSRVGEHVERLATPGALAPGVYVVSVAQGGERRTARAVVVR